MYHFYSQILKNLGSFHFSLFDFELFRLRSKKKKPIDWVLAKFKWDWFWIKSKYVEFDMFNFWQKFQSLGYCQPSSLLYFSRLLHKFFNLPVYWFLFNQYRGANHFYLASILVFAIWCFSSVCRQSFFITVEKCHASISRR